MGKADRRRRGGGRRGEGQRRAKRRRKVPWTFRILLILLPFLLLGAVEGVLRIAGVARPPDFFLEKRLGTERFLQPNPEIGERFFPPALARIMPKPNFQVLRAEKPEATRRILCLGESSTAGFPFPVHGSFPALLRWILEERSPEQEWEVVNCGLTAISSASVAELIDELLSVDPDALVLYLGHNEFYGAGGVGSTGSTLGRILGPLRSLRLVRSIERLLARAPEEGEPGTLMARMVGRARIAPDSELREKAARAFERNLTAIVSAAGAANVPVYLCDLASNERDHYPFGSQGVIATPLGGIGLAASAWEGGWPTPTEAAEILPDLDAEAARDTLHAGLAFLRGRARLVLDLPGAESDHRRARNLDAVPFRAPDRMNEAIRAAAGTEGCLLVPLEDLFRGAAPGGIPGRESFVEHLHPTILGNARIASAVADRLLGRPIGPVTAADAGRWLARSGLSRLDLAFADARVARLGDRWPYRRSDEDASPVGYPFPSLRAEAAELLDAAGDSLLADWIRSDPEAEGRAIESILGRRSDILRAHRTVAEEALGRGDRLTASRELFAAARLFPVDASLWIALGRLRLDLGDSAGAAEAARSALVWNPGSSEAARILDAAGSPAPR